MNSNGDKFVTYRWLIAGLISIVGGMGTAGLAAWQIHASTPHIDSVQQREFDSITDAIESRLNRLEQKIDRLLERSK